MSAQAGTKLTPYQRRLLLFLSVATFFEGYDFLALSQILPNLRADMGLPLESSGFIVSVVNFGTVLAFLLVRKADLWGRRSVLTLTIAGYTLFTGLTALAPNVYVFVLLQLLARVFLLAEWSISMVIAAEEFPADRRGFVIGIIQGCSGLGSVVCAVVVPILVTTPLGWRAVYLVGVLPLILMAYARRSLRETERFERAAPGAGAPLFAIWKGPYRRRLLSLSAIWFVSYIAAQNAVAFWKEYAVAEPDPPLTQAQVGLAIAIAAGISMPLVFAVGKLIDVVGRRRGALIVYGLGALGTYLCFTLSSYVPLVGALVLGIFGASAYLPVLNAYTTELFPTELRATAFAWSNYILGRIAYVGAPAVVGLIAGEVGGYGPIVSLTAVFPLVAAAMVWVMMPETRNRDLDATASI